MAYGDPYEPLTDPAAYSAGEISHDAIKGLGLGAIAGFALKYHLNADRAMRGRPVMHGGNLEAMGAGAAIGGALGAFSGMERAKHKREMLMAQSGLKMAMLEQAYDQGRHFAKAGLDKMSAIEDYAPGGKHRLASHLSDIGKHDEAAAMRAGTHPSQLAKTSVPYSGPPALPPSTGGLPPSGGLPAPMRSLPAPGGGLPASAGGLPATARGLPAFPALGGSLPAPKAGLIQSTSKPLGLALGKMLSIGRAIKRADCDLAFETLLKQAYDQGCQFAYRIKSAGLVL